MKASRKIATATIIGSLIMTVALANPNITFPATAQSGELETVSINTICEARSKGHRNEHDPIKALEQRKERVKKELEEGKITKQEADEIITKIDGKIEEIQEFKDMPLQQKKDTLIERFKTSIEQKVKSGKLPQDKADQLIKDYTEKINEWDGEGYPHFLKKELRNKAER